MKIRVTLKDPDTMADAVEDAIKRLGKPADVDVDEWESIREARAEKIQKHISSNWMEYGEYLTVEFDTEAVTATIVPNKE